MKLSTARKFLASFLLISPVLWIASGFIGPDTPDGNSTHDQAKALTKIAAHKHAFLASGLMFLIAALVFIVATYGIVHVYRGEKVGIGQIGGGLIAMGMAVFFAFYAFGITQYQMVNHAEFANPTAQHLFARLGHFGASSGAGAPLFIAFLLGLVLGPVLLGIGMVRRRNVPLWAGILVIVTGPAGMIAEGRVGNTILQVVLIVALAPLAMLIWRMSDEEWDAPREVAGRKHTKAPAVPVEATPSPALP